MIQSSCPLQTPQHMPTSCCCSNSTCSFHVNHRRLTLHQHMLLFRVLFIFLLCRAKLTSRIAAAEHDGTESRDFSWLVKALDQLRTARQVRRLKL